MAIKVDEARALVLQIEGYLDAVAILQDGDVDLMVRVGDRRSGVNVGFGVPDDGTLQTRLLGDVISAIRLAASGLVDKVNA